MVTQKWGSIPYEHAEWLSKNRLADPVTGSDSDGHLLSALTGGFHANFDGSTMEDVSAGGSGTGITTTIGDVVVATPTGTALGAIADVAVGRFFVSGGVATIPKYATAAASTAAGAITLAGAGVNIGYVEPVAANQCLMSNGVNVAPVYSPRYFSGVTAGGGQFAIAGLIATSRVVVTINSTLGNDLVFACAVPNAGGFIQFYTKDVTAAAAVADAAMADGIAVGVVVVTL